MEGSRNSSLAYSSGPCYIFLGHVQLVHQRLKCLSEARDKRMLMHNPANIDLPASFCWTRFGPEAGEPFEEILQRKELERRSGDGVFYWGIGSAIGPSLKSLLALPGPPEVLFSPIASSPRHVDTNPEAVVRWTEGLGLDGARIQIPDHVRVTSRWDPKRTSTGRYALVCRSDHPLELSDHGELHFSNLRNLSSGSPLGASQVTAVVRQVMSAGTIAERLYRVALRAVLVWPYLVRLISPSFVDGDSGPLGSEARLFPWPSRASSPVRTADSEPGEMFSWVQDDTSLKRTGAPIEMLAQTVASSVEV